MHRLQFEQPGTYFINGQYHPVIRDSRTGKRIWKDHSAPAWDRPEPALQYAEREAHRRFMNAHPAFYEAGFDDE